MLAIPFQLSLLTILIAAVWFIVFGWVVSTILTILAITRQRILSSATSLAFTGNDAPLVSVLVPARNEEHRVLSDCIRSILSQDYGKYEVIAVNDRSTDATASILEELQNESSRLYLINGDELAPGWLGKPYAMQQALDHAKGDWILATDADMIFDPAALRIALSYVLERNGDALTLIPTFEAISFWERIMIPTWSWVFLMFSVFYRPDDPKSPGAIGIGGFFLTKRLVLDSLGGYRRLKNEVMEDVRLAEMIKRSGARMLSASAPDLIRTRMYTNFREMWECSTKNWFSGVKFSLPFAMFCVVSMYSMSVLPAITLVISAIGILIGWSNELWFLLIPSALAWLLQVINLGLVSIRSGISFVYALTAPLGLGLIYAMLFDSSMRITIGKGVTWKGRRIYERNGVRPPAL
jgi:chlorobactene glucosyltransferase